MPAKPDVKSPQDPGRAASIASRAPGEFPPVPHVQPEIVWDRPPVPRHVGLALGGGAARGSAHIGVLQVLAENDIPVYCVVGTSAGAIVGGLFAAGVTPDAMANAMEELRWSRITSLSLPSVHLESMRHGSLNLASMSMPLGILELDRLMDFVRELVGAEMEFDQLSMPFAAIATDITSGEMVVMNDGPLAPAIRASCGIPGIFTPYRRNGRLLIDGGAVNNLPVTVARQMGAEYVIAVDLLPWARAEGTDATGERDATGDSDVTDAARATAAEEPGNIVELSLMALYALVRATQSDSPRAHLTVQPDIAHISLMDLAAAPELIAAGRAAAEAALPEILRALGRTQDTAAD